MPKKTRKQKIAADKRHHTIWIAPHSSDTSSSKEAHKTTAPTIQPKTSSSIKSNSLFTKDLYKSIFISAAIILLEIGIYIAQKSGVTINQLLSF